MRLNEEHAYDDRVCHPAEIEDHLVPEYHFRKFVLKVAKHKSQITAFYALVAFVAFMYPEEFNPARVEALKKLGYKVFIAYHEEPPHNMLCKIMRKQGISAINIGKILGMTRENVYHHLKRDVEVSTKCLLTHGEYNLMLDFMDAWNEITQLGVVQCED